MNLPIKNGFKTVPTDEAKQNVPKQQEIKPDRMEENPNDVSKTQNELHVSYIHKSEPDKIITSNVSSRQKYNFIYPIDKESMLDSFKSLNSIAVYMDKYQHADSDMISKAFEFAGVYENKMSFDQFSKVLSYLGQTISETQFESNEVKEFTFNVEIDEEFEMEDTKNEDGNRGYYYSQEESESTTTFTSAAITDQYDLDIDGEEGRLKGISGSESSIINDTEISKEEKKLNFVETTEDLDEIILSTILKNFKSFLNTDETNADKNSIIVSITTTTASTERKPAVAIPVNHLNLRTRIPSPSNPSHSSSADKPWYSILS